LFGFDANVGLGLVRGQSREVQSGAVDGPP
jgi:hypothetical protein